MIAVSASALQIVQRPEQAEAMFHPVRLRLLELLEEPGSAASVAEAAGIPRQHAHYHLRELERVGLVELVHERKRGNVTERTLQAARSYVVDPSAMGDLAPSPERVADRFSLEYLIALSQRTVREAAALIRKLGPGKTAPSFTLDAEIALSGPEARAGFAQELTAAIADLIEKYHAPTADSAEPFRLVLAVHPQLGPDANSDRRTNHERIDRQP